MLNIGGLALAYNGDGSSDKEKILYVSALLALAAGEAYPLSMMDSKSIKLDGNTTWLSPSIAAQDTTIPNFILGSVQGIRHVSTGFIELDMIFLRAPWGLRQHDAELETANQVFPEMIKTTEPLKHTPDGVIASPLKVRPDSEYDKRRSSPHVSKMAFDSLLPCGSSSSVISCTPTTTKADTKIFSRTQR
jgi:hypothetical protein